jgi:hypothetical protein
MEQAEGVQTGSNRRRTHAHTRIEAILATRVCPALGLRRALRPSRPLLATWKNAGTAFGHRHHAKSLSLGPPRVNRWREQPLVRD